MKRPCEDSSPGDSEDPADVASDIYPAHMESSFLRYDSPTTTMTTTQVLARKRRRGIIEKRRRDRINSSLSELRRLVPPAVEKQASAKLEKAEILQMTVDHLKLLRARGNGAWDAQAMAMDFLSLGFRECVWEVSRFLSVEGLDCLEPLRSRLLSHLTSCASQRHAAAATFTTASQLPVHHQPPSIPSHHLPPHWAIPPYGLVPQDATGISAPRPSDSSAPLLSLSTSRQLFPIVVPALQPITSSSSQSPPSRSVKPYRPWGDEVGAL